MTYRLERLMPAFLIWVLVRRGVSRQRQIERWLDGHVEVLVLGLATFLICCGLKLVSEFGLLSVFVCFESFLRFVKHVDMSTNS